MEILKSKRFQNVTTKSVIYAFLFIGAVFVAIPYVWMFVTSIKPIEEVEKELMSVLEGIEYRVIEEKEVVGG